MGFVNLLKLLYVVAWPLITLMYPLYASIRAIESNSHAENRKWLTYWVLCGLIMLFEFAFEKLIEWIPFWPHIKLMVTLWLVLPHYDGSVYAYDHFVRPCFTLNPNTLGYLLRPKQDGFSIGNSDDFLLLAARYVQEKGSEALEKLIGGKVKCVESNLASEKKISVASVNTKKAEALEKIELEEFSLALTEYKEIPTTENKATDVTHTDYNATSTRENKATAMEEVAAGDCTLAKSSSGLEKIKCVESNLATEKKITVASVNNKKAEGLEKIDLEESRPSLTRTDYKATPTRKNKATSVAAGDSKLAKSSSPSKGQREWTCALCQVCTSNEALLHNHFQGRKHKAKERGLILKQLAANNKTASASNLKNKPKVSPKEALWPNGKNKDKPKLTTKVGLPNANSVKKPEERRVGGTRIGDQRAHTNRNNMKVDILSSLLWCEGCKLQCNSLSMMTDHLAGKKHLASLQKE